MEKTKTEIEYPIHGFHFRVDFMFGSKESEYAGTHESAFQEVTGLKASIITEDTKELGFAGQPRAFITGRKFDNITLKRGLIYSNKLVDWFEESLHSKIIKHAPVIITALNTEKKLEKGKPLISWLLYEAYPISYAIGGFDASKSAYLIETIELRYSYFTLMKVKGTESIAALKTKAKIKIDEF